MDEWTEGFVYQPPPAHASVWWEIKEAICVAEMQILKRLGFNMQVSLLSVYQLIQRLRAEDRELTVWLG